MTFSKSLIWAGSGLAILGLLLLGYCIIRALAIRREGDAAAGKGEMQLLVALNMAAVGIASIGLGCVVVGIIL